MSCHIIFLPFTEKTYKEVALEFLIKDLGEEIEIGNECSLEDDGNVRSIEQLDRIRLLVTLNSSAAHCNFYSESLFENVKYLKRKVY